MTTTDHTTATASRLGQRSLRWTIRSFTVVIVISLLGGITAALAGGSLTRLGEGAGGLYGFPSLATTLIALFVAIPSTNRQGAEANLTLRDCVGGATLTQSTRAPWSVELVAA